MSAAVADFDHDGFTDLFVTNDTVPDFLFRNKGDGSFEEIGLLAGVSVPASGRPVSSMGVDFQDYDNDGWEDIFVTALAGETFPLFHNDGRREFTETTRTPGSRCRRARLSGWCAAYRGCGQRRVERHLHRQLSRQRSRQRVERMESAEQPVAQRWSRPFPRCRPRRPVSLVPRQHTAAAVLQISMATAGLILRFLFLTGMRNSGTTRPSHRIGG